MKVGEWQDARLGLVEGYIVYGRRVPLGVSTLR